MMETTQDFEDFASKYVSHNPKPIPPDEIYIGHQISGSGVQSLPKYDDRLIIRIIPSDNGVPANMLGKILIAHQEAITTYTAEKGMPPNAVKLRIVEVSKGSFVFKGELDWLITMMPSFRSFFEGFGRSFAGAFSNSETIEVRKSITYPKAIRDTIAQAFATGGVKEITGYDDEEMQNEVYKLTPEDIAHDDYVEPKKGLTSGGSLEFMGQLNRINWKDRTCLIYTDVDGDTRKIEGYINDDEFLKSSFPLSHEFRLIGVPFYKTNRLGEKSLELFQILQVQVM